VTTPPARPKIFHITHVDNLRSIVAAGEFLSDAAMVARGGPVAGIGMSTIKQRRLALPVTCHANDHVGDYVPFYFCARSIMLYVIHCANHPDLTYRGGQAPIVHMQADFHAVVAWARRHHRRWAFSLSNAGAMYASFRADPAELDQIDWNAVASTDFRNPTVKEAKQVVPRARLLPLESRRGRGRELSWRSRASRGQSPVVTCDDGALHPGDTHVVCRLCAWSGASPPRRLMCF
jgi:hypothetical protein